jgi:methyl-accepting chemotaxis protein
MPSLLEGLKTAFITSGVGIFFSIIISIKKQKKVSNITMENIVINQLRMIDTLEKSLAEISKSANEEIINSLEKVVKEFNSNLNEQFGQNFKDLNHAVKEMVVWQNNYKSQIKNYEKSLSSVLLNLEHISKIKDEQEKNIDEVINNLSNMSKDVSGSLKKSTEIVEESLHLLLREANGKI